MTDISEEIFSYFKDSEIFLDLQRTLQSEVIKSNICSSDIRKHVKKYIKESGYSMLLQNKVYSYLAKRSPEFFTKEPYKEPLDHIKKAQRNWEKCIVKSINSMCTELSLPLSVKRSKLEQENFTKKFNTMTLGADYNDEAYQHLRPVYSSSDFFEVVTGVVNRNIEVSKSDNKWGMLACDLYVPDIEDLKKQFKHLTGCHQQCGIDDIDNDKFANDWKSVGEKVIAKKNVGASCQYLKQGCSHGLRKFIWLLTFDMKIEDNERLLYEELKHYVFMYDMLVDYLIMKDVRLTATNDDSFFVFEDVLNQVLLVFSRDTWLLEHFQISSANPPSSFIRGKLGMDEYAVNYPPCGVFPFHGFSMLVAPLCYVFSDPVEIYFVFRYLYSRYLFRLHTITSHPEGIISLCFLFEILLQSTEPVLCKHLNDIGSQPLRIIFKWLLFGFSGYLAADQTLKLWDRIIGYDSLLLLPIACVAILSYRKENIMSVSETAAVEAILADLSTIKVIPVLVTYLSGRAT